MAFPQPLDNLAEIEILRLQQHKQVIDQIGRFVDDFFPIVADRCKRQFHALFADLLCNALATRFAV